MESLGGAGSTMSNVAMFVVVGIAIYYFYKWLSADGEFNEAVVFNPPIAGMPATYDDEQVIYKPENISLYEGGEFSISTWIYIADWSVGKGLNKPFLAVSGGNDFATIIMYIGKNTTKLGVRVSNEINTTQKYKLTPAELNQIRHISSGSNNPSYSDEIIDKCDIETVDMQRWVNITLVLNGKTVDVYIDGKMSRSCVLNGVFLVAPGTFSVSLGSAYGFGGLIGKTQVSDFAYSPDQVYKIYQSGPNDTSIWTKIKSYFSTNKYYEKYEKLISST